VKLVTAVVTIAVGKETVTVNGGVGLGVGVGVGATVAVAVAVVVAVAVADAVAVAVAVVVAVAVAVGVGVGVGVGLPMVKFVSEISKKMLPTASTFIRAVVVDIFGIVTDWLPSLGVLARSVIGKVLPPSVEREILTFAALTGAAVVLLTFHVTVKVLFGSTVMAVFGAVTAKGPAVLVTETFDVVVLMPPALARLSRAMT